MGIAEATVIARISTALNDPATAIWGTATIAAQLLNDVGVISEYSPQLAKATVTFSGTARELSISAISDYLDIEMVEFPIDKEPKRYVNFTVRGSSVVLDDYKDPVSSADTAYIWYAAPHTVSGTVNTMSPWEVGILMELTAAHLLQNISRDRRETINIGGGQIDTKYIEDGNRREQVVMSRLMAHVESHRKFAIRYPDVE